MVQEEKRFSCFIIGSDTLLTECGEILFGEGHEICGIISDTPRLVSWAKQRKIRVLDPASNYELALRESAFDYLFAITYLAIIPASILAIPRKGAINFHDGPLPRYAGLNTPAWALMNQEPTYGVTWHLMSEKVDGGKVFKQRLFDVAPQETALSLNTRCFGAAIETFAELALELANGTAEAKPQDAALGERTYYGKHQRPPRACVLDWTLPAQVLDALVRALDFGRYPNPLGSPKVCAQNQAFIVTRAEAKDDQEGQGGPFTPGTIVSADDQAIVVQTGEGTLALLAFTTLIGRDLRPADVLSAASLSVGQSFDVLSSEVASRLTSLGPKLSKAEAFWARRLSCLEPVEIPFATATASSRSSFCACVPLASFPVPEHFRARYVSASHRLVDAITAACVVYFSRIGGKDHFHLGFSEEALEGELKGLFPLVATQVPLEADVADGESFDILLQKIAGELDEVRSRATFLRDCIARQPETHGRAEFEEGRLLPVAIAQGADLERYRSQPGVILAITISRDGRSFGLLYDEAVLSPDTVGDMGAGLARLLSSIALEPKAPVGSHELLSAEEKHRILVEWNQSDRSVRRDVCIHRLIEEQVARTPQATAVIFEERSLTFRELDERASRLASRLITLGIGPDRLVGIFLERSLDLVVAILSVLKAGGAYVPLDPTYPKDRVAFMIEDSKVEVLLTDQRSLAGLPQHAARVVCVDKAVPEGVCEVTPEVAPKVVPERTWTAPVASNLAYVIYTSGSTGKPKGVMVEHRNVVNFFAGMDERVPDPAGGTWLAVTSLSFDISVLELLWTLTRGFRVVVARDRGPPALRPEVGREDGGAGVSSVSPPPPVSAEIVRRGMQFGLFMWGNDDAPGRKKYDLMLQGAKYFDENNFDSVWTPERHFHAFGGPYPNPSVTGAAIAVITSRVKIRAGSCVSPLHHPIRIAEEWSVVDNLSDGRVGLSFASGWMPDDFVLRPENHKRAKAIMFEQVELVRRLWRGEPVAFENPLGQKVETTTLPRPVQGDLPIWITTAGNAETYEKAGAIGANILTHLLGQSVEEVAGKIEIYRRALREHGHDPAKGQVTLMLHTFVGEDVDRVREIVRKPMKDYLAASVSLVKNYAWAFPAFKRPGGYGAKADDIDLRTLSKDELEEILEFAFLRYFESSGLFGTPARCLQIVNRLKSIGVDEIACLLDFGVSTERIIASLPLLKQVRDLANPTDAVATDVAAIDVAAPCAGQGAGNSNSIAAQLVRYGVTHMQCTPSMARMMLMDDDTRGALAQVRHLMIGGEAFPVALAKDVLSVVSGTVTNMYGPTETTVWSSTHPVSLDEASIPIGRPIANTQLYVLDRHQRPVPVGVPGELCIGGDGVVRGYLGRTELTAERFPRDPFRPDRDLRIYRTGDVARFRKDGVVEFLGRADHQVKIRGYRIELGEIETLLAKHSGVRECVAIVREDTPGDQRLVVYWLAREAAPDPVRLKEHLRVDLPEYMVPSHFVLLDALPLTPNGKVDRKALPPPDAIEGRATAVTRVAPENEIEVKIAEIWQDTLGKTGVGVEDNFFDIGGHSLLVVKMHRLLKGVVDRPISLTDLYRFPTIRSFSTYLTAGDDSGAMQGSADRAQKRRDLLQRRRRTRPS